MPFKMVFDLRFKENFKLFISGCSGCGKTTFVVNMIKNLEAVCKQPPNHVLYFYKEWQPKFDYMMKNLGVVFEEDNVSMAGYIQKLTSPTLVIFDDMMNSANLKEVAKLFTVHGRHMDLSLVFISQRLFNNNEFFRQISQNSDYICVFKNPRNAMEIRNLAMQITPQSLELLHIFKAATEKPHSYLVINLTQDCPPQVKFVSNFFESDSVLKTYVLTNC